MFWFLPTLLAMPLRSITCTGMLLLDIFFVFVGVRYLVLTHAMNKMEIASCFTFTVNLLV